MTEPVALRIPDTSRTRVLVVGDVMLDRYWFGEVNRISPEAPVPVVKVERSEERLGGANVARNVAALGATATLLSVVGTDEAGQILQRLLAAEGIDASLHPDPDLLTTVKLRVIGRQQQLVRVGTSRIGLPTRCCAPSCWSFRSACPTATSSFFRITGKAV